MIRRTARGRVFSLTEEFVAVIDAHSTTMVFIPKAFADEPATITATRDDPQGAPEILRTRSLAPPQTAKNVRALGSDSRRRSGRPAHQGRTAAPLLGGAWGAGMPCRSDPSRADRSREPLLRRRWNVARDGVSGDGSGDQSRKATYILRQSAFGLVWVRRGVSLKVCR